MLRVNKVLLAYASMSGNTEAIADVIEEVLVEEKLTVNRLEVFDLTPEDIRDFDYIILGSYTWGDGELPDEFLDFYDEMDDIDFSQKKVAIFGSGDMAYDIFCGAVDLLEEKVQSQGGTLMTEGLKVELAPYGEDVEKCKAYALNIAANIIKEVKNR